MLPPNNGMQRTALRAAADAERWADAEQWRKRALRRTVLAVLVMCVSVLRPLAASSEAGAGQILGSRVRVLRSVDGEWIVGALVAMTAETVTVVSDDSVWEGFAFHDVAVVEVSQGVKPSVHRMLGGLFLGAIVGGLGWTLVAPHVAPHRPSEFGDLYQVGEFIVGAAIGGTVGLVVGHSLVEKWKTMYISDAAAQRRRERSRWP